MTNKEKFLEQLKRIKQKEKLLDRISKNDKVDIRSTTTKEIHYGNSN